MNQSGALAVAAAAFTLIGFAGEGRAADCTAPADPYDLSHEQANAVYECLKDDLYAGYQQGDKGWIPSEMVSGYRKWGAATTAPANPGFHGGRFLFTYVNETGFDAYTEYAEDPDIPAGTKIAKESFTIGEDLSVKPGPLFLMEKVAAGVSPETNDWYYMMVAPNGAPQAIDVETACSACHMENYGFQGGLGYPIEDVRLPK
ncbi:cytochrome P460 family protein [Pikeienuella piscinae]|uniref:Cytochrome P460 family protein n=1 Tax=Pikeienuella piscinae TaxID=2748098 RepID=A0A7L5BWX2_9RHOB|nr:cytochrome P460 family protein [Pikeienuella piscinae]QIE54089.1 cytochrome P460 family protein [Pikeienuella piscinae]